LAREVPTIAKPSNSLRDQLQVLKLTLLPVRSIGRHLRRIFAVSNTLESPFKAFVNDIRLPNFFTLFLRQDFEPSHFGEILRGIYQPIHKLWRQKLLRLPFCDCERFDATY